MNSCDLQFYFDLVAFKQALSQATKTVHSKGEGPYLCLLVYVTRENSYTETSRGLRRAESHI